MQFNELHLGILEKNPNACLICKGSHAIPIIRPQLGHKRRCFLGRLTFFFSPFLSQREYDQSQKRAFLLPKKQ